MLRRFGFRQSPSPLTARKKGCGYENDLCHENSASFTGVDFELHTSLQFISTEYVFQMYFRQVLKLLQGIEEISQPGY